MAKYNFYCAWFFILEASQTYPIYRILNWMQTLFYLSQLPTAIISAILRATMSGGFPRQLQAYGAHVQSTFRSSTFCFLELLAPPGSPGVRLF